MGLAAVTIIALVIVSMFRRRRMLVSVRVFMFVSQLIEVLVRIMKVDVPFPYHLANQIVASEKQERSARDAREPGSDRFAQDCAAQGDGQSKRCRHQHMSGPGELSHRDRLGCVPALDPPGQNERQPMGRNRGMEKRDAETCDRNRGENSLVHEHAKD